MIRARRIKLRALELTDVENYHRWINDEESNQTRGLYHPTSKIEAEEWVRSQMTSTPEHITFIIENEKGGPIGVLGFRGICTRSGRAELWIYIGEKSEWRKGYGREAIEALCGYGFDSMNLFRVWLECDPGYERIMAMYQKAGFVLEGRMRKAYFRHGEYRDTCILGLLRDERNGSSHAQ